MDTAMVSIRMVIRLFREEAQAEPAAAVQDAVEVKDIAFGSQLRFMCLAPFWMMFYNLLP